MKKVLITGITGMVGSHLADYILKNTNWTILGIVRWRSPLDNISHLIKRINDKNRIKLDYADLNDLSSLINLFSNYSPDYVYHLAAQSFPKTSFSIPLETYNTNILGTARLLEALRISKLDPWIHVCSSSEVYGRISKEKLPIKEDYTFHPASPYAISKIGTDLIGRYHAEAYGQKIIVTRMFTHTGPRRGDIFAESTFAKQIALIEEKHIPPVVVTGNLDSLRTYADVRDAVKAYHLLLTKNPQKGEYYNIGGNYVCTVEKMLHKLISLSKVKDIKIKIDEDRIRPIDADLQVPDCSKFTKHTGWTPEIPFEKTMEDLLNYWRKKVIKLGPQLQR